MKVIKNGVKIFCNIEISDFEVDEYLKIERDRFPYRKPDELHIKIDGDEVLLLPKFYSVIRLRRITGYLSNVKNFNQAKVEESNDRVKHFKV